MELAKFWVKELKTNENPYIIILVGNKSDMIEKENLEAVSKEGLKYAYEANLQYLTASAKTGENVAKIFDIIIHHLPIEGEARPRADPNTVPVESVEDEPKEKGCGC